MSPLRCLVALVGLAVTLSSEDVQATEACGYADLVGEPLGDCGTNHRGLIPGTLEELLQALDQRLPKVLRDRCTEDKNSICDCHLEDEVMGCWTVSAVRTPLIKWFMDQGVATSNGIAKLVIIWLKRHIHGQDLRLNEEIAKYLASNREYEKRYRLGWTSGRVHDSLLERYHPEGSLRLRLGELIPFYDHFFFYVEEHAKETLTACWRRIPLDHPGIRFEVSTRLFFVPRTKKWIAQIESSTLSEEVGGCMARALSGLELPDYYGPGPYEVTVLGNRDSKNWYWTGDDLPASSPHRFPWLGLGAASVALATSVLLVWRRLRRRGLRLR
jgi:hypothetical protein